MGTLLVRNAAVLATMDGKRREIADGGLFARDGWIEQVGRTDRLPREADEVLDARDGVVLPGLINTHHHLYQTLTRAVPAAQDAGLFVWLRVHYPIWARITPDDIGVSTRLGLTELALSGCTTAADHLYLFPNGSRLDDQVEAAREIGIRFHATRGSMSLGKSDGGLPPDDLVEEEEAILDDCRRAIEAYHDAEPGAMLRVAVAPCSPFSVTPELMREAAALARDAGVGLHTHLAETADETGFCLERFGKRPLEYAEELGWAGDDVWYAHAVFLGPEEIERVGRAGTGVAHCPTSNMRLASGIAPLRSYRAAGVPVGLGVDGSASNDGSHLLAEARQALLLARLDASPELSGGGLLTAREALEMATLGGAAVLGRDDIGSLETGKCADFFVVDLDRVAFTGALHDPVAAVVLCAPATAEHTYVHGRAVVTNGVPVTVETGALIEAHNRAAGRLLSGA
ncbi:MAG: 8-oxoguanine deaminase [Acidimicrobiia bacterium]